MPSGYLTTHVLDTALGQPAAGLSVTLYRVEGAERKKLAEAITNADGRTDAPILGQGDMAAAIYELVFDAGSYLAARDPGAPPFLGEVPLRFGIADAEAHYHVPLLLSPFGYSTYRGS